MHRNLANLPSSHVYLPFSNHSQSSLSKPQAGLSGGGFPFCQTMLENIDVGLQNIFHTVRASVLSISNSIIWIILILLYRFCMAVKVQNRHKFNDIFCLLQVIYWIVKVPLSIFIKMNQTWSPCWKKIIILVIYNHYRKNKRLYKLAFVTELP